MRLGMYIRNRFCVSPSMVSGSEDSDVFWTKQLIG